MYCGTKNNITRDHVPPKAILMRPYPPNLFTVPACAECNNIFYGNRDENLKIYLATMLYSLKTVEAKSYMESARRTLSKNNRLKKQYRQSFKFSKQGVVRINKEDREEHRVVIERIVKGLYFYAYGRNLPCGTYIGVYDLMERPLGNIFQKLKVAPSRLCLEENVFYALHSEVPGFFGVSLWEIYFYKAYVVRVFTCIPGVNL